MELTHKWSSHAKSLSGRSLQSMVLTGNKIHDDGAALIIQELCMYFLLTVLLIKLDSLGLGGAISHNVNAIGPL